MTPIRVGYHRLWGVFFLIASGLSLVVYTSTRMPMHLVLGGMLLIIGALYLVRPFLVIEDGVILVKNLLGLTMRRFRFGALGELVVEPGAILIGHGRDRQRLKVSKLLISRRDLDRLAAAVEAAQPAPSAK